MLDMVAQFQRWLRSRGMVLTPERLVVASTVRDSSATAINLNTVFSAILKSGARRISRATVFRTLELLQDAGCLIRSTAEAEPDRQLYSIVRRSLNPQLCAATHSGLISGQCPWCGGSIVNGQLRVS